MLYKKEKRKKKKEKRKRKKFDGKDESIATTVLLILSLYLMHNTKPLKTKKKSTKISLFKIKLFLCQIESFLK